MLFLGINLVESLVPYVTKQLRYEQFYKYNPLILPQFSSIYNVFINIGEYSNDFVFISAHKVREICKNITTLI